MTLWDSVRKIYKRAETTAESAAAVGGAAAKKAGAVVGAEAKKAGALVGAEVASLQEKAVSKLLGDKGEKLSALLDKLRKANLDDAVKSWIAKGKNKTVTAGQVQAALGDQQVNSVAKDMGVSKQEAAGTIAKLLPTIIDKLTPDGLVPDPDALAKRLTGLLKK